MVDASWSYMSFREAGVILIDCDHRTPPAATYGHPYVAIPQIKNGHINLSGVRYISDEHFKEWTRKANPQPYDVLLSRRCNPGETAFVKPGLKFAVGQNLVLLRSDGKKVHPPYLRWLTRGPIWWEQISKYINVGAVFDSLKCADVPKFELPIPPPSEQKAIAAVLGALDDKIELNRRMNATLEMMARTLFKSWFVNFDPVRAKMEGTQPFGMDAATAALFPSRLVSSPLGDIPEGWEVKPLDKIAKFLNGLALQKYPATAEKYLPVIKISQIRQGSAVSADRASVDIPPEYIIEDGDVIFSWSGSLMQVLWTGGRGALNQHLFKVTSDDYPKWLYYLWVEAHMPWFQGIAASKATTMGHIQRIHLEQAQAVIPPAALINKMDEVFSPIFKKRLEVGIENKQLADMRDYLLPKLISGDIRIPDAEKFVEAA